MFKIRITDVAERDIQQNFEWWRDNRSPEQAARWYDAIYPAIETLTHMPDRCTAAREQDLFDVKLLQLSYGIGRKATHRILFTIEDDTVIILKIMHHAQQDFTGDI